MIDTFLQGKVVIDNTVLSNFSKANVFYLIRETLKGIPVIMLSVKREALVDPSIEPDVTVALEEGWLTVEELSGRQMLRDYYMLSKSYPHIPGVKAKLGDGEAASLVYAYYNNCALLTDDNGPKKRAKEYGITAVGGSLAILYFAHTENKIINIDDCDSIFRVMKENGAYFPKRFTCYRDALFELEEKFKLSRQN